MWKSHVPYAEAKSYILDSEAHPFHGSVVAKFKDKSGFCCVEPQFIES